MVNVLFIGDSITDYGNYVKLVDTFLKLYIPAREFNLQNIGLNSETTLDPTKIPSDCNRPSIFSRLEAIIKYYDIDRVVIFYGINDGLYKSFSEERFDAYKKGLTLLVSRLKEIGAKIYLCTPSAFDIKSSKSNITQILDNNKPNTIYFKYNEVMSKYAEWTRTEFASNVEHIIDINTAMNNFFDKMYAEDKNFVSGDGIHPNLKTSAIIASSILHDGFGFANNITNLLSDKKFVKTFRLVKKLDNMQHSFDKKSINYFCENNIFLTPSAHFESKTLRLKEKIKKM